MSSLEKQEIYLIGKITSKIIGRKLPSNKQVLQLLFYKTRELKMKVNDGIVDVYKEVKCFWHNVQIPIKTDYNIRK